MEAGIHLMHLHRSICKQVSPRYNYVQQRETRGCFEYNTNQPPEMPVAFHQTLWVSCRYDWIGMTRLQLQVIKNEAKPLNYLIRLFTPLSSWPQHHFQFRTTGLFSLAVPIMTINWIYPCLNIYPLLFFFFLVFPKVRIVYLI